MNSTGSREAKARVALDKAEKIIIEKFTKFNLSENSKDNLENIRKMWNSASSGYSIAENFTDIPEKILKSKARTIVLFVETAAGNVLIDSTMGESKMKQMVGALGDAIIAGAALLTPQGWIITGANLALSLVDWDLGSIFKKIYGEDNDNINITSNGFIEVRNNDSSIYTRPLSTQARKILNINGEPSGSIFGDRKGDVLFGSSGDDLLQGRSGNDFLLGGAGYDTYFADGKDTIRDEDGKGQVYFHGRKLTDGTQIEKGSNIYKTKDNIKYELIDNKLIVNDSLIIEDFNSYRECLDIALHKADEIAVNVSNANAVEKAGKMNFTISLSRELKEGEFVKVTIPAINGNEAKTYMFLHYTSNDFKVESDVEYIFESSTNYEYTWSDDKLVEPDKTVTIKAAITDKSDGLIAKDGKIGTGTIKDDDDPESPNDTFPDTTPASNKTSPIVIDLNGDGIKTISRKNNKTYFDLDNNKFAENTSWIDKNDGILINKTLITNSITNGSELFGNHTLLRDGSLANNGFEALKEFANLNLLVA